MKKKLNLLIAVLFMGITIISGGVRAFGAGTQPDSGTLTIHKHWAEDNSQIGAEGDGTEKDVDNPPVEDVQFNIYKLTPKTDGTDPSVPPSEKDGAVYSVNSERTELTVVYNNKTYYYTMGTKISGKTDDQGELTFSDLKGIYYVEEDLENSTPKIDEETVTIVSPAKPFIVSVPMTNTSGDDWITNVHVYPKNQGLNPTKDVEGAAKNSVNIGDEIEYRIKVNIPSDIEEYSVFKINDKLDGALTYKASSAKVYVYKQGSGGTWQKLEIPNASDVNYKIVNPTSGNSNTLSIEFTADGLKELQNYLTSTGGSYTHVGVEFTTTVNENVVNKENYTIVNEGEIEWNNDSGTENKKTPTPETKTNTGEVKIIKKDQKGTELSGAEFQIAKDAAAAEAGEFIKVKVSEGKIIDLVYPGDDGYAAALNWIIRPHASTGLGESNGNFYANSFVGLQTHGGTDNVTPLKYYVVETKAPEGFNLLDAPAEVDFTNEKDTHILEKEVINSKGFKLPNTGSLGMIILTIVGIILIGLALLMILPKKRRS